MVYGELFRDLAHRALLNEEEELSELNQSNPDARPMSILQAGEVALHYLITKKALRDGSALRIEGEVSYEGNKRSKVDICFLKGKAVCASFEVKMVSLEEEDWRKRIRKDVEKHLDRTNKICRELDDSVRYNVALLISPDELSSQQAERHIEEGTAGMLKNSDSELWASEAIKLNHVDNDEKGIWNYMSVVVFTGGYTPARSK